MSLDQSLSSFADTSSKRPDLSHKEYVWANAHDKVVGAVVTDDTRDGDVYVKIVKRGSIPYNPVHYYVKGGGYAISNDILRNLLRENVNQVLVYETDTGDTYEWNTKHFKNRVDTGEYEHSDYQKYATESDVIRVWDNLSDEIESLPLYTERFS